MSYTYDRELNVHRAHGCFLSPADDLPGFERFWSTDPRFPATIAYPAGYAPFYDFNRPDDLAAEFADCFNLICQDAGRDIRGANLKPIVEDHLRQLQHWQRAGGIVAKIGKLRVRDDGHLPGVGRVVRADWGSGDGVFFWGPPTPRSLWSIRRSSGDIDDEEWETVLDSFRFLTSDWFARLPARFR